MKKNPKSKLVFLATLSVAVLLITVIYVKGTHDGRGGSEFSLLKEAIAAQHTSEVSPVKVRRGRFTYYPNTEDLAPDEMRIISLGTGMPNPRPSQKATCFLVELGNGDKFLFDLGTGSSDNLAALSIPYNYLNKVFISHLHTDHFGDFGALFVGGLINGRTIPLRVWGPNSSKPEWGTKYALEHWRKALTWDVDGRAGRLPASGQGLEINEFDYRGENKVVYQENGVTIRSWPANHVLDGSVSYSLEWNGLKFIFGGDTYPNRWYVEYSKGADVAIHECFIAVPDLIDKMNFPVSRALNVGTQIHTAPPAFGKVMSMVKPRMAIAYHFFNDFDTAPK
jgi:ribonuclease Z